jgi:RND family efflux transporter MFP subunit
VKAGQVLATIEVPELQDDIRRADASVKRCKEDVERARAGYDDAHVVFTRLQAVVKARPNLVAPQEMDSATGKDRSAASALAAAEAQVEIAKAELSKLKTMECYCRITAPFAGVITERFADSGALIPAGTSSGGQGSALFRLSQNEKLRLDIPVSVSYAARVKPGDAVDVHIPALNQTFSGVVARTTQKVDTATRTLKVEVDVPNPSFKILPGMYAAASLRLDTRKNTLVLPVEAVSRGRNISVLVVNKEHKLEERAIGLGLETPAKVEVLSGLAENDLVLVGSRSQFRPGQLVEPRLMAAAEPRR